jgi:hypothetical protein
MSKLWRVGGALLLATFLAQPAHAATPAAIAVDVALVLLDDVSLSINDDEFALQKAGWFAAFNDPRVINAIVGGTKGAIAVEYEEFASDYQVQVVIPWTVIHDAASSRAFAKAVQDADRSARGRTAIGEGVALATKALAESGFAAQRKVIDVCGDGTNNSGPDVTQVRDAAVAAGIVVNGLTIINDHPVAYMYAHTQPPGGLTNYYREHVTGGPGSFVLEVHDFASFGKAMTRKLVDEIALRPSRLPAG